MKKWNIPPTYFYLALFLILPFRFFFPGLNVIPFPFNLSGLFFVVIGVFFIIVPYKQFVKYNTPEKFLPSTCVVRDGLYNISRNPMYLGALFFLLGFLICLQNPLAILSPFLFFCVMNFLFIPYEEKKMQRECGEEYLAYKKKVRRWF